MAGGFGGRSESGQLSTRVVLVDLIRTSHVSLLFNAAIIRISIICVLPLSMYDLTMQRP